MASPAQRWSRQTVGLCVDVPPINTASQQRALYNSQCPRCHSLLPPHPRLILSQLTGKHRPLTFRHTAATHPPASPSSMSEAPSSSVNCSSSSSSSSSSSVRSADGDALGNAFRALGKAMHCAPCKLALGGSPWASCPTFQHTFVGQLLWLTLNLLLRSRTWNATSRQQQWQDAAAAAQVHALLHPRHGPRTAPGGSQAAAPSAR